MAEVDLDAVRGARDEGEYLRECIKLVPEAIDEEFVRTPADVAYWNARYADALDGYLRAKAKSEVEWARLWLLAREKLIAAAAAVAEIAGDEEDGARRRRAVSSGPKPTEKMIDAVTQADPEWQAARETLIVAEVERARALGRVEAVRTKKDMLQSLGAKIRAEIGSDPVVRARHEAARDAG